MPDAIPPTRLTLWRLTVAASGLAGVWLASREYDVWWTALSQQGSLAVGIAYLSFVTCPRLATPRLQTASSWLRGALATLMVLIAAAFAVMQHGNGFDAYSIFEHMVTPALVVTDYLIVASYRVAPRWWHPLSWLLPPTAYLVYYVAADLTVYVALDTSRPTMFTTNLALLLGLLLLAGFGLSAAAGRRTLYLTAAGNARSALSLREEPSYQPAFAQVRGDVRAPCTPQDACGITDYGREQYGPVRGY
jgi:hypothetical protein